MPTLPADESMLAPVPAINSVLRLHISTRHLVQISPFDKLDKFPLHQELPMWCKSWNNTVFMTACGQDFVVHHFSIIFYYLKFHSIVFHSLAAALA